METTAPTLGFFGLEKDPFAPTADPEFFYFTIEYERAIYGLKRSIDSRYGIVAVRDRQDLHDARVAGAYLKARPDLSDGDCVVPKSGLDRPVFDGSDL